MPKIHKKLRKISIGRHIVGDDAFDKAHFLGTSVTNAYDARKEAEAAVKEEENKPVIPMADEETIARVNRRRNARRGGGRASTVLTDYEGMGG